MLFVYYEDKLWVEIFICFEGFTNKKRSEDKELFAIIVSHEYNLPVVQTAGICQALVHSTVNGGLGSFPWTFNYPHKEPGKAPLPHG